MKWPFGVKHRNEEISTLPQHYLRWVLKESNLNLKGSLGEEVRRYFNMYANGTHPSMNNGKQGSKKAGSANSNDDVAILRKAIQRLQVDLDEEKENAMYFEKRAFDLEGENFRLRVEISGLKAEVRRNNGFDGIFGGGQKARPNGNGNAMSIYKKLAFKWHPDKGGTKEAMQAINDFKEELLKH